jgi:hypothetical protein
MEVLFGKQLEFVGLNTTDWTDGGDGYFYYLDRLHPGAATPPLFEAVRLDESIIGYSETTLTVTLIAETVETRHWHYREAWWGSDTQIDTGPLGTVDSALRGLAQ